MATYTIRQIADELAADVEGSDDVEIRHVRDLVSARAGDVVFLRDQAAAERWAECGASAAVAPRNLTVPSDGRPIIRTDAPASAWLQLLELFAPPLPHTEPGAHATATVSASAKVAEDASVGPNCVIGPDVELSAGVVLYAHVTVLDGARIGEQTRIYPGTVVGQRCIVGRRCTIHGNVTLGADGFGYQPAEDGAGLRKIPQIGWVEIGDDVELGAGVCIDRGTVGPTTIGDGCKIDNLCQIAHNCRLGRYVVLAGQVGLAGSVTVGDGVMMGGKVAVRDHVTIGDGARLAAACAVMDDVPAGATWGGYPARDMRTALKEHAAVRKLPEALRQLRKYLRSTD